MADTTTTTQDSALASPLGTVHAIYDAFGEGDMDRLYSLLDENIEWGREVDAAGADQVPVLNHGFGLTTVEQYFSGVAELEFHHFEPHEFHADDDVVIVLVLADVTHRATGRRKKLHEVHHWTIRSGKAIRYRPFSDTAAMIELYRA